MRALLRKTSAFTARASGMLAFEVWDCIGIPVVQQQRTTEIQRREREAPLIIKFAEHIGRLGE
jgi:hypothetical protein